MSVPVENTYAGDIAVEAAYQQLAAEANATLIDVRTEPEWQYVGTADLSGLEKTVIYLPWQVYPAMQVLPNFVDVLSAELRRRGIGVEDGLLFLCRSGIRSRHAAVAMTAAGWKRCYNLSHGFEGPLDAKRRRSVAGWKAQGLPWTQT